MKWMAPLIAVAVVGCGDDNAVGRRDVGGARDLGVDMAPPPADVGPQPMRAHDATIVDFGADEPRTAPVEATEAADEFPGEVRFFARNLSTGETAARAAGEPVFLGSLSRIMPVLAYTRQVAVGVLDVDDEVTLTAEALRHGGTLKADDVGASFRLEALAERIIVDGDRSAEELLVAAVGGVNAVNSTLSGLGIPGFGRYAAPCELDRLYASALDPRFAMVDCPTLSAYVHGDDASGLTPDPFPTPPEFTTAQIAAAWASFAPRSVGTATAEALARLLAKVDDGTALSLAASVHLRALLDGALGDGGPGDEIAPDTWVGNLNASVYGGRHWMGLVRGGEAPFVFVALSDQHARPPIVAIDLFSALADQLYGALVGPDGSWPPAVPARPDWVEGVFLLDPEGARACDTATPDDFDAVLECRRRFARGTFEPESATGGTVFLRGAPAAEVAWFWSRPDGARRRYQVRFSPNNWWIWTRTLRVLDPGRWQFAVYVNGQAVHAESFEVR